MGQFPLPRLQANDSGAWLWCSKDDWVIDAIRKVGFSQTLFRSPAWYFRTTDSHLFLSQTLPQMTHANVGSLLVYDPAKVKVHERDARTHDKDAVVGIITERGN